VRRERWMHDDMDDDFNKETAFFNKILNPKP
jgi:hypothetical protein